MHLPTERTSPRAPRAASTGRPPWRPRPTGTRCAPSSIPVPRPRPRHRPHRPRGHQCRLHAGRPLVVAVQRRRRRLCRVPRRFPHRDDTPHFYRENSPPAPSAVVTTASAPAPASLEEAVADFRGVAAGGAPDQTMVAQGRGSFASVGPTASVPAGELVVAAVLTGGQ